MLIELHSRAQRKMADWAETTRVKPPTMEGRPESERPFVLVNGRQGGQDDNTRDTIQYSTIHNTAQVSRYSAGPGCGYR
ncbi:hypothetical protein J6590_064546 [Homalodisca vitripennis]|nr:hypothetical protein J6590_064546 [Homalodisca vitripennis]